MATDFLDWALADFSGYVAADELYDGPFCVLSAVDNRCYKRILYDVLDHDPTHEDIRAFLRRLHTALAARDLTLRGITTGEHSVILTFPVAAVDTVQTPGPGCRYTSHSAALTCDCCWLHTTRPLSA
jgi:hypothetical protein